MAAKGGRARVEVEGAPELRRAFRKLDGRLDDLSDVNRDAVRVVEDEAESLVHVLSGALRDSIRSRAGRRSGAVVAGGTRLVPYAGPIHFGWRIRNIEPQPFLYDALDHRAGEVVERYERGIDKLVRRFDSEAPD